MSIGRSWKQWGVAGALVAAVGLAPWSAQAQQAAAVVPPAAAAALPAGLTLVTEVEGIAEYRIANGLQLLLVPDASKPTTTVNVTYRVGSRHENYGETGMAHLLEHLLFKGTPTLSNLLGEFSRRGLRVLDLAALRGTAPAQAAAPGQSGHAA